METTKFSIKVAASSVEQALSAATHASPAYVSEVHSASVKATGHKGIYHVTLEYVKE